jgi:hypothetical protein
MAKKQESTPEEVKEPAKVVPFDFDDFQPTCLADYDTYNYHVRKAFREAKKANPKCDPPFRIKIPDQKFHKMVRVKFQRFDQPENLLKVRVVNKDIDWEGQIKPGCVYDLPLPVVKFLNRLATPIFAEVKVEKHGEVVSETRQVGERNRFSCHLLEVA